MEENPYKAPKGDLTPPKPETYLSRLADAIAILGVICLVLAVSMCGGASPLTALVVMAVLCVVLGGLVWWRYEFRSRSKLRRSRHNWENNNSWRPEESDPPKPERSATQD